VSGNLIEIKNLSKNFIDKTGYKVHLLEDVSLNIEKGKITSLLAPKDSGKSTLLKMIAGIEPGLKDESETGGKSKIYIPSRASSFPWLDVESNITYNYKTASEDELKSIISLVGLEAYDKHYPDNRSLGFRFRIALGRSLIRKPDLILIDESFNEMPSDIKDDIYNLLLHVKRELSLTLLIGTSNISEAVLLSDVIYLMDKNPGKIIERFENELGPDRTTDFIKQESFRTNRSMIEKRIAELSKHKFMDYSF
jgi:ABC-type nitrate/sulfonate/bicarbonate transport system ATPase subunit